MTVTSYTIPNLIQGVSQQAPEQRRPSQHQAQLNCINSPKDGVVSRPGVDFLRFINPHGGDFEDAAFHEIFRGAEHYLVVVPHMSTNGKIRVFNLLDGGECLVNGATGGGIHPYLGTGAVQARSAISFQTVDDYTFVANKLTTVAMTSAVQTTRPPEALVFVKAGAYRQKYTISIVYSGNKYIWSYETPDNSVAGNASYINTAQIAATLYRALTGGAATIPTSGAADDGSGVGPMFVGDPGGTSGSVLSGTITATSLGFTVKLKGNVLYIARLSDSNAFTIDSGDGTGNSFMASFKDTVKAVTELPQRAFEGFRLKVTGATKDANSEYYIEYVDQGSLWRECLAGGENTTLNTATMPHALINTGVNTFSFGTVSWGSRVVGDSVSAPLPYFVGQGVQALFHHQERLGLLTLGAYDLSKARNSFSFFRDTMQTVLATDPISSPVKGEESISLLRKTAKVDESLFLWSPKAQWRVTGGAEGFRPESIENKPSSAFEFAEECRPKAVGNSLHFATDGDLWATIRTVTYSAGGRVSAPLDVTAHVPEYIPSGVSAIVSSETLGMLWVHTDGDTRSLFNYSYVVQGTDIVQSAWNKWQFPLGSKVLWSSEYRGTLYMVLLTGGGLMIGKLPLRQSALDPSGNYLTRLDMRVIETQLVGSPTYNAGLNQTTMTLPYPIPESASMVVAIRTTGGGWTRGQKPAMVSAVGTTIVVSGNIASNQFYVGVKISSEVELSQFYPRGPDGQAAFAEDLRVNRLYVSHKGTCEYRVAVTPVVGSTEEHTFTSGAFGVPEAGIYDDIPVQRRAADYTAKLINDTIFPCQWQRVKVGFETVSRFDARTSSS